MTKSFNTFVLDHLSFQIFSITMFIITQQYWPTSTLNPTESHIILPLRQKEARLPTLYKLSHCLFSRENKFARHCFRVQCFIFFDTTLYLYIIIQVHIPNYFVASERNNVVRSWTQTVRKLLIFQVYWYFWQRLEKLMQTLLDFAESLFIQTSWMEIVLIGFNGCFVCKPGSEKMGLPMAQKENGGVSCSTVILVPCWLHSFAS